MPKDETAFLNEELWIQRIFHYFFVAHKVFSTPDFLAMQLCQRLKERLSFFDHSQPDRPIQQGIGMKDIVRDMRIQQT